MTKKMERVALVKCESYDLPHVEECLKRSIDLLGGLEAFIKPGMRVLLKCNLVMARKPEECATTHPAVVEALVNMLHGIGAVTVIGDSPGGLYSERTLKTVYRICGMQDVAERTGAHLNYGTGAIEVSYPDGRIIKKLTVMKLLKEVDAVISLPKLKTHGMTLYTGAVKNLFGVIPGTAKAEYHWRMKELAQFTEMLVDVCSFVKPVLSIMDGILAMEDSGPTAGTPRKIGAILAAADPFALDVAAASLAGIALERVCTIQKAGERGLCSSLKDIDIVGNALEELAVNDFKLPVTGEVNFITRMLGVENPIAALLNSYLAPRPAFIYSSCIGCRDCEKYCPPKAISMKDGRPRVNMKKCIRCYCCQELCPRKAVEIKRNWIFRLFK